MSNSLNMLFLQDFTQLFDRINVTLLIKIGFYIVAGILVTLYASRLVGKLLEKNVSRHHAHILRRLTFYIGIILSFLLPLRAAGVDVNALLGAAGVAAGILTAAVAFASQTLIANFLSGVFLLAERPFQIGDTIEVGNTSGEVLSIDLLSVKIRTSDNVFVRIPNDSLLKTQSKNQSRFPIRRCDILLKVALNEDLEKIKKILITVAQQNPLCLVSPEPEFNFVEFSSSALVLKLSVWTKQASYQHLRTSLQSDIQVAFRQNEVEFSS